MSLTPKFAKRQSINHIHCIKDGCKIKEFKYKGSKKFESCIIGNNGKHYDLRDKIVARSFLSSGSWYLRIQDIDDCLFYFSLETKAKFYFPD